MITTIVRGLPWWLRGKESTCNAGDPVLMPGLGRFPWRKEWHPTPLFLPGESHRQRSPVGYRPEGLEESDTTEATENTQQQVEKGERTAKKVW